MRPKARVAASHATKTAMAKVATAGRSCKRAMHAAAGGMRCAPKARPPVRMARSRMLTMMRPHLRVR